MAKSRTLNKGKAIESTPVIIETIKEVVSPVPVSNERNTKSTKRKGKPVTLYLNTDNYKKLKQKAKKEEVSVSALIDQFIVEYLLK